MSPTWGVPVGDGQKRTRTSAPEASENGCAIESDIRVRSYREGLLGGAHRIHQRPDSVDLDLDGVTGLHGPDPGRRPGQDDVPGQQREDARRIGDDRGDVV